MSLLIHHTFLDGLEPISQRPALSPRSSRSRLDPLLDRAMALAKIGAWSCDLADNRLSWTTGVYELFGLPVDSSLDRRQTVELYDEESRETMGRMRAQAIAQCGSFALDAMIIRPNGDQRWMRLTGEMHRSAGQSPRLHGLKQDITEDKARWEAMRHLAENDALTGLANRAVYEHRFLNASQADNSRLQIGALVLFDLDGFKGINDQFGHAAGDTCLRVFSERLSANFPDALLTARIGGDEFALIIGSGVSVSELKARIAHFIAQLLPPIHWQDHMFSIRASMGIAVPAAAHSYDPEELFLKADAALYTAKKRIRR